MKEIHLTKGYVAIVDDDDFELVMRFKWHACPHIYPSGTTVYAMSAVPKPGGGQTKISLHRLIMGVTETTKMVDHVDHDGLNCRKENLRVVTGTQNQGNRKRRADSKSPYKGITWKVKHKAWSASIKANGRNLFLGHYKDPVLAAKAYDDAARSYFGEHALTNFGGGQ